MKKALLLSSLIATSVAFAATNGSVEAYMKPVTDFTGLTAKSTDNGKTTSKFFNKVKETKFESGLKTEVKVKDSGLSFGANLIMKDESTYFPLNFVGNADKTNAWIKYEFPSVKEVKTYAKASMNFKSRVNLEGDLKTKVSGVELGLNSKLGLSLLPEPKENGTYDLNEEYVKPVLVVKGTAKSDISVLKDVKLELEARNNFTKKAHGFEYVSGTLTGKYGGIKDLELTGTLKAKYQFSGDLAYFNEQKDDNAKYKTGKEAKLFSSYVLDAKYKGIKDVELTGKAYLQHLTTKVLKYKANEVLAGLRLGAEYSGVENLTLSANAHAGVKLSKLSLAKAKLSKTGIVELDAKAVYSYKVTDKLTLSPELGVSTSAKLKELAKENSYDFNVTPALKAEYKVSDLLTLTGKASLPVDYSSELNNKDKQELKYESTKLKSEFNIKYTW